MNREYTNGKLSPTQVITIYNDRYASNFYLEHSEVRNINGKLMVLAPTPMNEDVFRNIASSYMKQKAVQMGFDGLIPPHILYGFNKLGLTAVIWYRPAMRRSLNFGSSTLKGVGLVPIPATIYILINTTLYVYALASDDRPDLKTKLYNAPFFNIYADGNVCMGTARVGKRSKSFEGEAERFERAFFLAEQGDMNAIGATKTSLPILWKELAGSNKPFPQKELVQQKTYKTLGEFINKKLGNTAAYDEE
jgi:PRTRC genetic system protein B